MARLLPPETLSREDFANLVEAARHMDEFEPVHELLAGLKSGTATMTIGV